MYFGLPKIALREQRGASRVLKGFFGKAGTGTEYLAQISFARKAIGSPREGGSTSNFSLKDDADAVPAIRK